jgi:hypothetical protein
MNNNNEDLISIKNSLAELNIKLNSLIEVQHCLTQQFSKYFNANNIITTNELPVKSTNNEKIILTVREETIYITGNAYPHRELIKSVASRNKTKAVWDGTNKTWSIPKDLFDDMIQELKKNNIEYISENFEQSSESSEKNQNLEQSSEVKQSSEKKSRFGVLTKDEIDINYS